VDLNGDGQAEVIVPDSTSFNDGSAEKPYGGLSAFDSNGNLIWEQKLLSKREQLDRLIAGPDVNDDGWRDVFVVTDDATKHWEMRNEKAIFVDAISGCDGEKLWWNRQVIESDTRNFGDTVNSFTRFSQETLRWWNIGNDGWPTLLVGIDSDLFAFSPKTGRLTGNGQFIDEALLADGNADGLEDLFLVRNGKLVSYRGRPQINWMRSWTEITGSSDVDGDGINDFVVGDNLISGRTGKRCWKAMAPLFSDSSPKPAQRGQMHILDHDINKDGFKEVLAYGELLDSDAQLANSGSVSRSHVARLLSGDDGRVLWKALRSSTDKVTSSSKLSHVKSEVGSDGKVEIAGILSESYQDKTSGTWLVRLRGNTGEIKWEVPLFATTLHYSGFQVVHKDLNNDGVKDTLAPSAATTDSAGMLTNRLLHLRAYDGRDGSLIWEVPVAQASRLDLHTFPELTVVETASHGIVVIFYDHSHRPMAAHSPCLRIINGAIGQNTGRPLDWRYPIPTMREVGMQLPHPVVIKDRKKGEYFIAFSLWTLSPTSVNGWNGNKLEPPLSEEVLMMDSEGKIVTRFGLPEISGNRAGPNRQRLWSHDTNQDGIDELIILDSAGLTAIDPFSRDLVWSWERPHSLDLRLHAKAQRTGQSTIGMVKSKREVFGINLSNGITDWVASDKPPYKAPTWRTPRPEKIHVLNHQDAAPRVIFLNDKEAVCVTSRSTSTQPPRELLPLPSERMARNDPRNRRYLPWVDVMPFAHINEPGAETMKRIGESLVSLPLLVVFVIVPWFCFKQIVRHRRFSIRSLVIVIGLTGVGMLFFTAESFIPEAFKFRRNALLAGLVIILPPFVFIYSVVRMLLLGQWKALKWWSAVMLFLTLAFAMVAVVVEMKDFAPEEVYSYDYGWTLILWLGYCTGAFLIAFEFARICCIGCRYLASAIRRSPHPPATA
jgi:hypothetical protein